MLSFCAIFALAGCAQNSVTGESRLIDVMAENDVAAEPASTGGISRMVTEAGPSYVTLNVSRVDSQSNKPSERNKRALTSGSGFVVDSSGLVMTAAHVAVEKGNLVAARAGDGKVYTGTVIGVIADNDMALIKLSGFSGKAVIPAAKACVPRGTEVFSLGKPHDQRDVARSRDSSGGEVADRDHHHAPIRRGSAHRRHIRHSRRWDASAPRAHCRSPSGAV